VGFLVHDHGGLMVSYRGALALKEWIDLPDHPMPRPAPTCAAPCLTACPVGALSAHGYDTAACHATSTPDPGTDCMEPRLRRPQGLPLSRSYGRLPEQSAYHMRHFHP
jgi:epoxyqueuosine reductase